jgi:ubiquinone/menaquinone biosynthesis C-methylase UbiE
MGNTERFTGRAPTYDIYRQRYPAREIVAKLQQWCGLRSDWHIADVGAGTGMLAEVFLANGNAVLAVEPNDEMRSICSQLIEAWPALQVMKGTAEATGLPDRSVDMVAAGRAFHWFDTQPALTEFRRILKPGGWLNLVSLGRAKREDAQSLAFEALLLEYGTDFNYVRASYRIHEDLQHLFTSDFRQEQLHSEQRLDWPRFRGQTMSFSMVPHPADPRFAGFERALREHFDTFAEGDQIALPTTCWINAGRI